MWTKTYSKVYKSVDASKIWKVWTDVNRWQEWDADIKSAKLNGPFQVGSTFILKPKGGPAVTISLVEVEQGKVFTDCTPFFGAKMYGRHEIEVVEGGIRLTATIIVEGWLGFFWRRIVAQGIVDSFPEQMDALVELARKEQ